MQEQEVARKLELCVGSFKKVLYEPDDIFLKNMEKNNLAGDDISKYQLWEWTQGVGLYGLWKLFERTKDGRYLATLREYYDARIADGLPGKNINTMAPVLALSYLYEYTGDRTTARCAKRPSVMDSLQNKGRRLSAHHVRYAQRRRTVGRHAVHDGSGAGQHGPYPGPAGLHR
ncbi:MAG: glycoside hydrolase family 88 protein [Ruthenibacterium lactatiformans]